MKTLFFFLVSFTMVLLAAGSAHSGQQPTACIFAIVLDTSPTAQWDQIRKGAENIFKQAEAGDTVLLFEVRGLYTHLRFSCIKPFANNDLDTFQLALQATSADWFMHADLSRALGGPIYEKLLQHAGKEGQALLVILSGGDLNDTQATTLCKFADNVKATHGWPLLLASSPDKTNRQLLIAAGKGRLYWCKLADAADRALLEKLMQDMRPGASTISGELTPAQPIVATNKQITSSGKETSVKPETAVKSLRKVQEASVLTEPNDSATKHPVRPVGNAPAWKEASGKETFEPNLASGSNVFNLQSSVAGLKTKASSYVETSSAKPSNGPDLPASVVGGERQVKAASSAPVQKTRTSLKENSKAPLPSRTLPFGNLTTRLLAIGCISAVAIIAFLLIYGWAAAATWQRKVQNPVEAARRQEEKHPRFLMARIGGSSYCLGNPQHFNSAHLGSSLENTIRINNESVAPRHLRIYRRGSSFFIRNLSRTPVVTNGQEIGRRKRCRLTFPAAVSLCEGVTVQLLLAKSTAPKQSKSEESKNGE